MIDHYSYAIEQAYFLFLGYTYRGTKRENMPSFYFDNNGNDTTGNGSQAAPWKTVAKCNAVRAAGTFNAESVTIAFKGGQLFTDAELIFIAQTPSAGGRLVVTSWGSGQATIKSSSNARHCVSFTNCQNFLLKNIKLEHLVGSGNDTDHGCLYIQN